MPEYSRPRYAGRRADLCRVTILWIILAVAGFEMFAVFQEQTRYRSRVSHQQAQPQLLSERDRVTLLCCSHQWRRPAHPVAVPRERDGAYSEKNQGGHAVLSEMSCPGVTNSSDGGDPTRYEFPRHSGYDAAGRSLAISFVAGRHGFSICIRDDMRRCRRENCDDSRGCSLSDQRAPR